MPSAPPVEWPLSRKVHFLFEERGIQRTKFDAVSTSIILKLLNRGIVPSRKMLTHIVQKLPPEPLAEFIRLGEEQEKNLQRGKLPLANPAKSTGAFKSLIESEEKSIQLLLR